jgi:hypothetical protein
MNAIAFVAQQVCRQRFGAFLLQAADKHPHPEVRALAEHIFPQAPARIPSSRAGPFAVQRDMVATTRLLLFIAVLSGTAGLRTFPPYGTEHTTDAQKAHLAPVAKSSTVICG